MIQSIVQSFVVSFVVRQLEKFHNSIDWAKVQADADVRVRALVPGTWFDDYAVGLVDKAILTFKEALGNEEAMKALLGMIAERKYNDVLLQLAAILDAK